MAESRLVGNLTGESNLAVPIPASAFEGISLN